MAPGLGMASISPQRHRRSEATDADPTTVGIMAWVYILKCTDGTHYVGSTKDLEGRVEQHASGRGARYTSKRRPVSLVWAFETDRVDEAWALERQIHGWSRAKREALIAGQFEDLHGLSGSAYRRNSRDHSR